MDNFTDLQKQIELSLPFILIIVFFLLWRALNSYWIKELTPVTRDFQRGDVEYFRSSRPTSETYDNFLHLAHCSSENKVETLSLIVSKIANEYLSEQKSQLSPSLNLLMTNPHNWLIHNYSTIAPSSSSIKQRGQLVRDHFHREFIQILNELEQLL
ncbi:MAG: hypothetical protein ACFFFG_03335 [Candidatus Thorarchaeota archaeon]